MTAGSGTWRRSPPGAPGEAQQHLVDSDFLLNEGLTILGAVRRGVESGLPTARVAENYTEPGATRTVVTRGADNLIKSVTKFEGPALPSTAHTGSHESAPARGES